MIDKLCPHCGAAAGRSLRFIEKSALGLYEHPSWECGTYLHRDGHERRGDECHRVEMAGLRAALRPVLLLRVATAEWWDAFEHLKKVAGSQD